MPCEVCGKTYQLASLHSGDRVFWCPHCGTTKAVSASGWTCIEVPAFPKIREALLELVRYEENDFGMSLIETHGGKLEFQDKTIQKRN